VAIQRYFVTGNRFHYDTSIPADDGPDALADFLLHTRRGFCQQFATAMTVMARISGIPARVAVGFTRGTQQANGSWLVTTHDAHAWPELWFQGIGWVYAGAMA
jgi:transglutaminase-like putative cysteine protease